MIEDYLKKFARNDYQRTNFDDFLSHIKFVYSIPSIHIAGTNGKGSTAHYLHEIYVENGYKVGLFTTPDDFYETIYINDQQIDNGYVEKIVKEYDGLFNKFNLSSFEIHTFIALKYFADNNVDISIIECGMGGEIDATNVFTPILSIITSISIEHASFLGDSLSEIAFNKAGIIKNNIPVLIGNLESDALSVILNVAKKNNSQIITLDQKHNYIFDNDTVSFDYRPYSNIHIKNISEYSAEDACFAIEASKILNNKFPIDESKLKTGLSKMALKCRFEIVHKNPLIILDGAHNPEAITKLRNEMDRLYNGRNIKIVFAAFRDKNINVMLPEIGVLGNIYLTTFNHERARSEEEYFLFLGEYDFEANYISLIEKLKQEEDTDIILVTGSLAFVYEVRKALNVK